MSKITRAAIVAVSTTGATLALASAPAQALRPVNGYSSKASCMAANDIPDINGDLYCGYVRSDGRYHVWAAPYPNNY